MKKCLQCAEEFVEKDKRQRFCSRTCSATYNNLARGFRVRESRPNCVLCEAKLKKHQVSYCSHSCQMKAQRIKRVESWLSGDTRVASYADGGLAKWAKDYLLEECNYTCECGWSVPNPVLGRPILCIDHIDGNWTNNARENVKVLCYNCHTLTPTFGALNIGSQSGRRPGEGRRRNISLLEVDSTA